MNTAVFQPSPVRCSLWTPGTIVLMVFSAIGVLAAVYRFSFGLASTTNLDQQHPWGIWIAIDVATGVALAAGGFTSSAIAYVFHRDQYHVITRAALWTALLGYTFVGLGLMADLGRYYNIWHPILPSMWQGNSVLFEVGLCVMCYLTVLYIEFFPVISERLKSSRRFPALSRVCSGVTRLLERTMILFILAGVVLSCLHQSSLGNLMVIAPGKVHPLWYTPILSLLFLLSAVSVGFPMIIVESLTSSWALRLKPEMHLLASLARWVPVLLAVYLAFKIGDLMIRERAGHLLDASVESLFFILEVFLGVLLPMLLFLSVRVRSRPRWLFAASMLVVMGVAMNRVNVFLVAYQPPYATKTYFPSILEFAVTAGLLASAILLFRAGVTYLPIIAPTCEERTQ
ncbi:MAG: NrfD/PsrC family molybdoenzyme membrane anchor subunit [Planctomycetota bacterium]